MKCPSCGAEYADWARVCPYCGTVNERADEQAYLAHMEELRQRLDNVDEEAESRYHSGVSSVTKKVLRTVGIAVLAALAVAAVITGLINARDLRWEREFEQQKQWEDENFPVLDELYASGDYDKVIEKGYELIDGTEFYLNDWPHYWFVFECWYNHNGLTECKRISEESGLDSDSYVDAAYYALGLVCITDEQIEKYLTGSTDAIDSYIITPEEAELVRSYRDDARDFLLTTLGLTASELEELKTASFTEYGFVDYWVCSDTLAEMGKTEGLK